MPTTTQYLRIASTVFATIFIGFGINTYVDPVLALSFFGQPYPQPAAIREMVNVLLAAYGVRDVFMGLALYAAAYFGDNRTLGWITVAAGLTAAADGTICKLLVGDGQWNHWSYAPFLVVVGVVLASGR